MLNILIEIGVIVLLIYTPLAAGAVTEGGVMVLEVLAALIVLLWLTHVWSQKRRLKRRRKHHAHWHRHRSHSSMWNESETPEEIERTSKSRSSSQHSYRVPVFFPACLWGLVGCCLLIGLQCLPLPAGVVQILSPLTARLYTDSATLTGSPLPAWLPLSVCVDATQTELYKLLAYLAVFVVLVNTLRTRAQIMRLVYTIILVGVGEALYGLATIATGHVSGTFVNRNHFAGYLELVIPLAFGVIIALQLKKSGDAPLLKKLARFADDNYLKVLLGFLLIFVMLSALMLSGSRGGILSFALAMVFLCGFAYTRRLLRKWILVIFVGVVGIVLFAVLARPEMLLQRLSGLANPHQDLAIQYRWEVWRNALTLARDFPLFGSGFGTFSHLFARYQRFPSEVFFTHAENDYLQHLTETGGIGLGLTLSSAVIFLAQTIPAWKQQHSRWAVALGIGGLTAIFSLLLHSNVDFNLRIPSNALLLTVVAALTHVTVRTKWSDGAHRFTEGQHAAETRHVRRSTVFLLIGAGGLATMTYLWLVVSPFLAVLAHQQFQDTLALTQRGYLAQETLATIIRPEQQAIRFNANHAGYAFTLGSYLYRNTFAPGHTTDAAVQAAQMAEAEHYLKQAIRHDPANPWAYFELAGIAAQRSPCPLQTWTTCPSTLYYQAALDQSPYNLFLRAQTATWVYPYDHEQAFQLIQEVIKQDSFATKPLLEGLWYRIQDYPTLKRFLPESPAVTFAFSQFLYAKQLDYASDLEAETVCQASPVLPEADAFCRLPSRLNRSQEQCPVNLLQSSQDKELELGQDDGSADWRVYLSDATFRVKKVLCLPEHAADSRYAALRMFMNNGGSDDFTATISINDTVIHTYDHSLPNTVQWHEIPFDPALLRGKTKINVYVRVTHATASANYLMIWGDRSVPTTNSLFNFAMFDDLSYDPAIQTGEYMIRLILRKTL